MKLNEPGYPEVVVVNTGDGVLTKVGSVRGETCVTVDGDVSCISLEVCFAPGGEFATVRNF